MPELNQKTPVKNNRHVLRKLVGAVVIAGAAYAAEKIIESRKSKRQPPNKKSVKL